MSSNTLWDRDTVNPRLFRNALPADTATLDGEITALDSNGLPDFNGLRGPKKECVIVYYAFDLLYLNGYDLRACPLLVRKTALRRILPKDNTARVRYTDHVLGEGKRLFSAVEGLQLEGIVAKRKHSIYSFGRSRDWVKLKTNAGNAEMLKRIETWDS
jgi:bifunctional non-homologous end joining protein LigD